VVKLKLMLLGGCKLGNTPFIILLCHFFYNIGLKSMTGLTTKYVVRYIKFYLKNRPE
jgi:hypothetical protein